MLDRTKISPVIAKYDELMSTMYEPSVASDHKRFMELNKELNSIKEIVELTKEYDRLIGEKEELSFILEEEKDKELREMAEVELLSIEENLPIMEKRIKLLLVPKDEADERNVIIEIRAGAGGEEAALVASTIFKMYKGYATRMGYSVDMIDASETELGGFKEVIFEVSGEGAYSRLKFESGVHRVQRVPVTESSGRIHTSTCTVAVMPEALSEDVSIDPKDLKIDTFRASGAGGQHINRTDSAIRITHLPTGLVVQCQDERSQYKNKDKAMAVLQSRLWEMKRAEEKAKEDSTRKSLVGTGERAEKIRTYNYHQGRVTDHRIGLTLYKLEEILLGDLDEIIDSLLLQSIIDDE